MDKKLKKFMDAVTDIMMKLYGNKEDLEWDQAILGLEVLKLTIWEAKMKQREFGSVKNYSEWIKDKKQTD